MSATVSTTPPPTIMNAHVNGENAEAEGMGLLTPAATPPPSLAVPKAGEALPPRPSKASIASAVSPTSTTASTSAVASSSIAFAAEPSGDRVSNESLREEVAKVKKVNFWGWVDVGFSHGIDDYDRTPIETDPLTREGAIEVLQMRLEMRRATQELLQWRSEYEKAVYSSASATGSFSSLSEDGSSDFSDEPTENNGPQQEEQSSNNLRRTKSTPKLHHNINSQKLSAREALQQRFPPVAPDAPSAHAVSNATALYPHPKYPTHLLPRRRQSVSSTPTTLSQPSASPPHPAPPKRMQSMPVSAIAYPTTITPTTPIITSTATSTPPQQQPPVPIPRLRAASNKLLSPWPVLERPHSHAGTNSQALPSLSATTAASLPPRPNLSSPLQQQQQQPPVSPPIARRRDPSFTAQQAQQAASGARWTWNEALARDHQKDTTQEQQDAVFAAHEHLAALALNPPQQLLHPSRDSVPSLADSRPSSTNSSTTTATAPPEKEKHASSVLGGLVGFWKNDKS
ncbi:hypothetical protein HK100_003931 [Physocladia obscura]|uniref:Uncharacterized protein n=1 Tax=Physocladia obscura TaxID=109957 RepID=A0AAD5XEA1_9FUNG|nr:hypothetical protein HK100_003931 [Physocladia obscura]